MNNFRKSLIIIFSVMSLGFLLIPYHKAYALTNTTIYSTENNGTLSDSGRFKYSPSSLGLIFSSSTASLNTLVNSGSYGIKFWYYQSITTSNTYTLQLNFNDYDLYSKFDSSYVKIYVYNGDDVNQASIINVTKSNKATNYKTLTIKFISATVGTYLRVELQKEDDDSFYIKFLGPDNFRLNSVQVDSSQSEGTDLIINNQTNNTQNIINNDNSNTQSIIDNQNQNTQDIIDAQKVCKDGLAYKGYLNNTSIFANNNLVYFERNTGLKTFIYESSENKTYSFKFKNYNRLRVYESNTLYFESDVPFNITGTLLIDTSSPIIDTTYQITTSKKYIYFMLSNTSSNTGEIEIEQECVNGNQAISDGLNDLDSSINNSDVDNSDAVDFFNNFNDNSHGLSGIITAPLNAINSMLNGSCSPLSATYKGKTVTLDCGTEFWNKIIDIKSFLNICLDGLICYRILIKLFKLVEKIKEPEDDRIEVMDL